MGRQQRVPLNHRQARVQAYERLKAVQPDVHRVPTVEANRDGTVPRPRVGVVTPEQRVRLADRQRVRSVLNSIEHRNVCLATERMIGATLDFADLPPDEQALKADRRAVRIVTLGGAGILPQTFVTSFLIAHHLALTNQHMFRWPTRHREPVRSCVRAHPRGAARRPHLPSTPGTVPLQPSGARLSGSRNRPDSHDSHNIIQHPSGQARTH
jgi:hypothetical protein